MKRHAEDRALAARMIRGDSRAFDEFFEAYFQRLFRFALPRVGRNADAAEEVAQATLCAAISKMHTFRGEAALFSWLCTFCRHEVSAFYARSSRRPATIDLLEENPEVLGALESLWEEAGDDPERARYRDEIARLVQVTLDRLPRRYGDALEWKYIEGAPVREIAARLELGPKAAESLLTRARAAFRDGFTSIMSRPGALRESTSEG